MSNLMLKKNYSQIDSTNPDSSGATKVRIVWGLKFNGLRFVLKPVSPINQSKKQSDVIFVTYFVKNYLCKRHYC